MEELQGMAEMFFHIFWLFFDRDRLVKKALERNASEKEVDVKKEVNRLHKNIVRAFHNSSVALEIAIFCFLLYVWLCRPQIYFNLVVIMKCVGYFLILIGLLSPVRHPQNYSDKETLLEIVDEEWHRVMYGLGIIFLIISYLVELSFSH